MNTDHSMNPRLDGQRCALSRRTQCFLENYAPPLVLVGLLTFLCLSPAFGQAAPGSGGVGGSYGTIALNVDWANDTGATANTLEIIVPGTWSASDLLETELGYFTTLTIVADPPNTKFIFSGYSVPDGTTVHIGITLTFSNSNGDINEESMLLGHTWKFNNVVLGCGPWLDANISAHAASVAFANRELACTPLEAVYLGNVSVEYYNNSPTLASLVNGALAAGLRVPLSVTSLPTPPTAVAPGQVVTLPLSPPPSAARFAVVVCDASRTAALSPSDTARIWLMLPITDIRHSLSQPFGPGSLLIANEFGPPANLYFMAASLDPLNFTNPSTGWWFGLHTTIFEVFGEYSSGFPYVGLLDGSGASQFALGGGVPPGLALSTVTIALNPANGSISGTSNVARLILN